MSPDGGVLKHAMNLRDDALAWIASSLIAWRAAILRSFVRSFDGTLNIAGTAEAIKLLVHSAEDVTTAQWFVHDYMQKEIDRSISLQDYCSLCVILKWEALVAQSIYQFGHDSRLTTADELDVDNPQIALAKLYMAPHIKPQPTASQTLLSQSMATISAAQKTTLLGAALQLLPDPINKYDPSETYLNLCFPASQWGYVLLPGVETAELKPPRHDRLECIASQTDCAVECALSLMESPEALTEHECVESIVRFGLWAVPSQAVVIARGFAGLLRQVPHTPILRRQLRNAFIEVVSNLPSNARSSMRVEFADVRDNWYDIPELGVKSLYHYTSSVISASSIALVLHTIGDSVLTALDTIFSQAAADNTRALTRISALSILAPYTAIQWLVRTSRTYGTYPAILNPVTEAVWINSELLGLDLLFTALSEEWDKQDPEPVTAENARGVQAICSHLVQSGQVRGSSVVRKVILKLLRSTHQEWNAAGLTVQQGLPPPPSAVDDDDRCDVRSVVCARLARRCVTTTRTKIKNCIDHG